MSEESEGNEVWRTPEFQKFAADLIETVETTPRHKAQAHVAIEVSDFIAAREADARLEGQLNMLTSIRRQVEDWCDLPRQSNHECTIVVGPHAVGQMLRDRVERLSRPRREESDG